MKTLLEDSPIRRSPVGRRVTKEGAMRLPKEFGIMVTWPFFLKLWLRVTVS